MREKVYFENSKGDKLCGILSNPLDTVEVPIIVLCHGHSSNKDRPTFVALENELNKNNIAVFKFDFFGHGESEGKFEEATVSEAVDDILKAIEFVKEKGYKKIGLFGSSFGGISSIMAASKTKDLFVLALKSPVSDYEEVELLKRGREGIEEWKQRGWREYIGSNEIKLKLNYSFFEDIKNNNAYEAVEKIEIPTLIVHGDADETVPIEQSKKTSGIIKDCKLEVVRGADHRYTRPEDFDRCVRLVCSFVMKILEN
jgi:dipeptidyl aminopeptidase/acylaminoacyl peptidase